MSTFENQQVWPSLPKENLSSKYEKCLNITEEIYKRINITFQIKKLETGAQSDCSELSDQIDSNELSNETDLFACDKTDSIPSSDPEQQPLPVNNNNNVVKKTVCMYKKPKKKLRKRVKKRQSTRASETDGSSDEAVPLSRARVPSIIILTKDIKPKILSPEECQARKNVKATQEESKSKEPTPPPEVKETGKAAILSSEEKTAILSSEGTETKSKDRRTCGRCNTNFKSERALRRHSVISHSICEEKTRPEREVKPA